MMKLRTYIIGMTVLAAALSLSWGCKGKLPPLASMVQPGVKLADNVIDNFEDGNTLMNPSLRGAPTGTWANWGTDGQTVLNKNAFILANDAPGGTNSTPMAIHVFGTVTDPANATYPEAALQARFNVSPYYDASSFIGMRYKMKLGTVDNCTKRRVKMWTAMTTPAGNGGSCSGADCWNHYGFFYSSSSVPLTIVRDTWVDFEHEWTDLDWDQEPYWGQIVPFVLTEVIGIDWAWSRDNAYGTSDIDYWLDEVEFF